MLIGTVNFGHKQQPQLISRGVVWGEDMVVVVGEIYIFLMVVLAEVGVFVGEDFIVVGTGVVVVLMKMTE